MTGRIAVVGSDEGITVFKAAGVDAFFAADAAAARDRVRRLAADYSIIFVTEELYSENEEFMKRFDEQPYPVVLAIPSAKGGEGSGDARLKSIMERALGVDILFNK